MPLPDVNRPARVTNPTGSAVAAALIARIGAVLATLAIGYATLRHGTPGATPEMPVSCLVCGEVGGADIVRNLVLFVPFGIGLSAGWRRRRAAAVVLAGFLFSLAIEATQYFLLAGRTASLSDVLTNTLGTAVGALLVFTWPRWWHPSQAAARAFAGGAFTAWAALVSLGAWTVQREPAPPGSSFMRFPPTPGVIRNFEGTILERELNGAAVSTTEAALPSVLADPQLPRLVLGATVHAMYEPGLFRPLLLAYTPQWQTQLAFGQRHRLLVLRTHTRAQRLRLQDPIFALGDAFPPNSALPPGSNPSRGPLVSVHGIVDDQEVELSSTWGLEVRHTQLPRSPHLSWTLFTPTPVDGSGTGLLFTALWIATGIAPAALLASRGRTSAGRPRQLDLLIVLVAAAAVMELVPALAGLPEPRWWEWSGLAAGILAGASIGLVAPTRLVSSRPARHTPPP